MKAEYFPPKEDVILQNEAPNDFYIFVTGAAVRILFDLFVLCVAPLFSLLKNILEKKVNKLNLIPSIHS